MTLPDYYEADRVGKLVVPRVGEATQAGHDAGLSPTSEDKQQVLLLLVDMQVDFVHEDGALSVPGAVDDARRTIEWIYQNAGKITTIAASLDSHVPRQIFFPTWWADRDGNHPEPYTAITAEQVENDEWMPVIEKEWSRSYVEQLEAKAKKVLMIWPYHTLIGTPGHALTPVLYEAIAYHSAARQTQPFFLTKGSIPKTEHYSIMEPEVKVPDTPLGELNRDFLNLIGRYDEIYVAGQAKSHCVLETIGSMVNYYDRSVIEKMFILTDAMSSVAHPEIDFEASANETLADYAEKGVHLVNTAEAIPG
jgi:nicotinamidase-related amidase